MFINRETPYYLVALWGHGRAYFVSTGYKTWGEAQVAAGAILKRHIATWEGNNCRGAKPSVAVFKLEGTHERPN